MRQDPTSKRTYTRAIQLIENTFSSSIRKVRLFNITRRELSQIISIKDKFIQFYKGFYHLETDTIYIIDGNEEDLQTFIHETLHSNSILHQNNSPLWLYEGLTKALTEFIMKKQQIPFQIDYYLMKVKDFWLDKIQKHQKTIIQAYFTTNVEVALNLLKGILKTNKNLLEISFNEI